MPPTDCSYFEEMCWRAENEVDPENRGYAQCEVDRMVRLNNEALEAERAKEQQDLSEYVNEFVGDLFESIHFHSNDDLTRMQIRNCATDFLMKLYNDRRLYNFGVVCDASNNSQSVIDRNELQLDIVVKTSNSLAPLWLKYTKTGLAAVQPTVPASSGTYTIGGNAIGAAPIHGGYPAGAAGVNPSQGYTLTSAGSNAYITQKITVGDIVKSSKLPEVSFDDFDDAGVKHHIVLSPEPSISPFEVLTIIRLIVAGADGSMNVLKFIREQNLERHFRITT